MLVATPAVSAMADRKPRVISEIRKPFVQRSPSLDDLPRLSGTLNYHCTILDSWSPRQVQVKDGCLLVYSADWSPGQLPPGRGYASLGRPRPRPRIRATSEADYLDGPETIAYLGTGGTWRECCSGVQSLGRARGAALAGLDFRLPLRHLNLTSSPMAPLAFSLSYRQNGTPPSPLAVFQALSELDFEHWVKTLAVEIMRQTPLEAIRFLDVLGIATTSTPSTKSTVATPCATVTKMNVTSELKNKKNHSSKSSALNPAVRWDRSPSSEGSTTSTDFSLQEKKITIGETVVRPKRISSIGHSLPRRKLRMGEAESQSDRDEIDSAINTLSSKSIASTDNKYTLSSNRRSREKIRRTRDIVGNRENTSSSEETRTIDEGIVLEERGSSSERSCRRSLWPSDRSDCLDSPHSVSSYSSYELCDSPDNVDFVDNLSLVSSKKNNVLSECRHSIKNLSTEQIADRIYNKNISPSINQTNLLKKKCDKKIALEKTHSLLEKNPKDNMKEINKDILEEFKKSAPMPVFRAKPYIEENTSLKPTLKINQIGSQMNSVNSLAKQAYETHSSTTVKCQKAEEISRDIGQRCRARSCSPSSGGRNFTHQGRALSAGMPPPLLPLQPHPSVEVLKQRCQNTEKYVPVREKLALFESLCRAGRLARSSEELAGALLQTAIAPRARSLHDLTRERSPHVREICKFFENFGHSIQNFSKNQCEINKNNQCENIKVNSSNQPKSNCVKCSDEKPLNKASKPSFQNCTKTLCEPKIYNEYSVFCDKPNEPVYSKHQNQDTIHVNKNSVVKSERTEQESPLCEAFNYGGFKQIRLGNKIITYV